MDIVYSLEIGAVAAVAAILGSMLGLGGGVFLVPILTLFFGIDPKVAVGASAVVVVTNSVVGSTNHLRIRFTNPRLAMLLQIATAAGAIAGALYGVLADPRVIYIVFGAVLVYAAVSMVVRSERRVTSGMLGVGGGVVMVPVMNLLMRVPVKAAVGTSTFMVGMTSVATAFVFYSRGFIDPTLVVPAIVGVFVGGQIGSRLTRRIKAQRLALLFALILLYLGLSLLLRAFGVEMPGQA